MENFIFTASLIITVPISVNSSVVTVTKITSPDLPVKFGHRVQ